VHHRQGLLLRPFDLAIHPNADGLRELAISLMTKKEEPVSDRLCPFAE
jgi:hypothetical protein